MTTPDLTPANPEKKPSKTGLFFTAAALATVMVSAAGGGAAVLRAAGGSPGCHDAGGAT